MSRNNPPSDPDIQIPRLPISRLRMTRHYNFAPCDIFISHLATSPYRTLPPPTIAPCDSKCPFPFHKIMSAAAWGQTLTVAAVARGSNRKIRG